MHLCDALGYCEVPVMIVTVEYRWWYRRCYIDGIDVQDSGIAQHAKQYRIVIWLNWWKPRLSGCHHGQDGAYHREVIYSACILHLYSTYLFEVHI